MNQTQTGRNGGALVLIAVGILFFLTQTLGIDVWGIFGFSWPLFVMLPGLVFLGLAFFGDKKLAGFAIPGAIVTGTGALLWFQNFTGHWESWAYAWTLFPVFVGLGLTLFGYRSQQDEPARVGRGLVTWGSVAFLVSFAFFELLIFGNGGGLSSSLIPLILIGTGVLLFTQGRPALNSGKSKRKNEDEPVFTGPRVISSRSNGYSPVIDSDLQRRINEAIAEDDPDAPKTSI